MTAVAYVMINFDSNWWNITSCIILWHFIAWNSGLFKMALISTHSFIHSLTHSPLTHSLISTHPPPNSKYNSHKNTQVAHEWQAIKAILVHDMTLLTYSLIHSQLVTHPLFPACSLFFFCSLVWRSTSLYNIYYIATLQTLQKQTHGKTHPHLVMCMHVCWNLSLKN